MKGCRKINQLC